MASGSELIDLPNNDASLADAVTTAATQTGDPFERAVLNLIAADVGHTDKLGELMGIADRIETLGGRLRIESTEGEGTVLAAQLPLSNRWPRDSDAR